MRHAYLIGSKSRDKSTQIGAVLVQDGCIISEGYNGICRKVNDNVERRHIRPEKYSWYEHGERNSIYNAARNGIKTFGAVMFTNYTPCVDCGRAVIQAGLSEIVLHKQWSDIFNETKQDKWKGQDNTTLIMFEEAGLKVRWFDKFLDIECLISEKLCRI